MIIGEIVVELAIHWNDFNSKPRQDFRCKGSRSTIATGKDCPDRAFELRTIGKIAYVTLRKPLNGFAGSSFPQFPALIEHDVFQPGHFLRPEGEGRVRHPFSPPSNHWDYAMP